MLQFNSKNLKRKLSQENDDSTSSKEAKTSDELLETAAMSPSADGMGVFKNLCQEMFEKIVTYLHPNDILKLCLTSKSMNEYISNNEKIWKNITLKIPSLDDLRGADFGQRIYRKVSFYHTIRVTDLRYIKKIASHVKDIELGYQLTFPAGKNIIKLFKNATKICANFGEKFINHAKPDNALEVAHLKDLEIDGFRIKLSLFRDCQSLEKLTFNKCYCDRLNVPHLQELIIKQTGLKSLILGSSFSSDLFQNNILATDSKFKLKEFSLATYWQNMTPEVNFMNFFNLHRNTLEKLTIIDQAILKFVNGFPNLKNVTLRLYIHNSFNAKVVPVVLNLKEIPFVEILSINSEFMDNFFQLFIDNLRNLKEFRGKSLKLNSFLKNGSIEKLFLDSCRIPHFNMPNLRSAKFKNIVFQPKMKLNQKIQELSFDNCKNVEKLLSILYHPDVNLKLLEIINLEESSIPMIEANCDKIQTLIINNRILIPSTK